MLSITMSIYKYMQQTKAKKESITAIIAKEKIVNINAGGVSI